MVKVDVPKPKKRPVRTYTAKQVGNFYDTLTDTRLLAPALLAVAEGLREGEVLGLLWTDIDLSSGFLTIQRTLEKSRTYGMRLKQAKTKESHRRVFLSSKTIEALSLHKTLLKKERLMAGCAYDTAHDLVVPTPNLGHSMIGTISFGICKT